MQYKSIIISDKNGKRIPWSKVIKEGLINEKYLDIRELAKNMYNTKKPTWNHIRMAQQLICDMRKKIEKETGQLLVCDHGIYELLDHESHNENDNSKIIKCAEKRNINSIAKIESLHRAITIILDKNPELVAVIRKESAKLLNAATAIEML